MYEPILQTVKRDSEKLSGSRLPICFTFTFFSFTSLGRESTRSVSYLPGTRPPPSLRPSKVNFSTHTNEVVGQGGGAGRPSRLHV